MPQPVLSAETGRPPSGCGRGTHGGGRPTFEHVAPRRLRPWDFNLERSAPHAGWYESAARHLNHLSQMRATLLIAAAAIIAGLMIVTIASLAMAPPHVCTHCTHRQKPPVEIPETLPVGAQPVWVGPYHFNATTGEARPVPTQPQEGKVR